MIAAPGPRQKSEGAGVLGLLDEHWLGAVYFGFGFDAGDVDQVRGPQHVQLQPAGQKFGVRPARLERLHGFVKGLDPLMCQLSCVRR